MSCLKVTDKHHDSHLNGSLQHVAPQGVVVVHVELPHLDEANHTCLFHTGMSLFKEVQHYHSYLVKVTYSDDLSTSQKADSHWPDVTLQRCIYTRVCSNT